MGANGSSVSTNGRFRELGPLGSGGAATVVLAEDTLLRRRVALKRLHTAAGPRELARLRREALVGASLNHRNLVAVYDVYEEEGDLVIVMEHVPGETLQQAIRTSGVIPPRRAIEILRELAAALDVIHSRGVVHRDVKPANVLLGTGGEVKLADLGIAAAADRTQTTAGADLAGTFSYMAPEQLEGRAPSAAIDIYAFAAVAFELLCGRKARRETNPVALAHAISTAPPPDLTSEWPQAPAMAAAVLRRGMAADPAARPGSAGALVAQLAEALEAKTTEAHVAVPTRAAKVVGNGVAGGSAAAASVARRVPRAPSAEHATPLRQARLAPVGGGSPSRLGHGRQPVLNPVRGQAPGASRTPAPRTSRKQPAWSSRRARAGVLAALLLPMVAVAVAVGLGWGGSGQTTRKTGRAKAARSTAASRSKVARPHTSHGSTTPAAAPKGVTGPSAGAVTDGATGASAGAATKGTAGVSAGSVPPAPAAGPAQTGSSAQPPAAVEAFYEHAARHEYAAAWELADANMRNQVEGFGSFQAQQSAVRSISFHRAQTIAGGGELPYATVALQTTAVLADRTEQCGGTARLVRSATAGWLLDGISIDCTP